MISNLERTLRGNTQDSFVLSCLLKADNADRHVPAWKKRKLMFFSSGWTTPVFFFGVFLSHALEHLIFCCG